MTRPVILKNGVFRPQTEEEELEYLGAIAPVIAPFVESQLGSSTRFRAWRSSSLAIAPGATETQIPFSVLSFGETAWWNSNTPGQITVPSSGFYLIGFSVRYPSVAAAYGVIRDLDSNIPLVLNTSGRSNAAMVAPSSSALVYLSQGQRLGLFTAHSEAGSRNIESVYHAPVMWGTEV